MYQKQLLKPTKKAALYDVHNEQWGHHETYIMFVCIVECDPAFTHLQGK
jgi:hypothetical protein